MSYNTPTEASTFLAAFPGATAWHGAASTAQQQALDLAQELLDALDWKGTATGTDAWPRSGLDPAVSGVPDQIAWSEAIWGALIMQDGLAGISGENHDALVVPQPASQTTGGASVTYQTIPKRAALSFGGGVPDPVRQLVAQWLEDVEEGLEAAAPEGTLGGEFLDAGVA